MRIGIDLRLQAYAPGGISRYARHLAMELAPRLAPETLTLIQHRRDPDSLHIPHTRTVRAWTPPHHPLERWALGAECFPLRLDILHSTDFIPPAWGARRFVITVHDLNFLYYPQYLTAEARRYYNNQIQWAVSRADAILADSTATQQDLVQLLDVAPERVSVVALAADEHFRPLPYEETQKSLRKYGLSVGSQFNTSEDKTDIASSYILFIGTWEPRKNLLGLLEALAMLHARGERRHLVIAGRPGWLYDEIFTRVQSLKLASWVHFMEHVPERDLCALYNGALLLTMPSFYEGFGLPALEAMQCGTPTVVSDRASLPEVVGDAGLLVNPDDPSTIAEAFWRVARDEALRAHLREAGLAQARRFTWAETARKTLEVYKRL